MMTTLWRYPIYGILTSAIWGVLCFCLLSCSSSGSVVVRSEPANAQVYVVDSASGQSALIGQTPLTFSRIEKATKGSDIIQLRVEKDGFQARTPAVASFGGGTTFLDVELIPAVVARGEVRESFEKARQYLGNANRLVLSKRYADALGEIEKVIELDPKNTEALAAKGSILYLMKDFDGAATSWSRALELNPNFDTVRSALIDLNMEGKTRTPAQENKP
jgi:hypothetical protein